MLNDYFVIDAVSHAYNMSPDNIRPGRGPKATVDLLAGSNRSLQGRYPSIPQAAFFTDWGVDNLAQTHFVESHTDMVVNHHLSLYSWFRDGGCSRAQNVEVSKRWPHRFLTYIGVDPLTGVEACKESIDAQVSELAVPPVGLKLYPHQIEPYRSWRMDDRDLFYPLVERAGELGIRTIGVHKAMPIGPFPVEPYRIDDLERCAMDFPDMNFEIIHAGWAFLEQTCMAIERYENVYANLESTSMFLFLKPPVFAEILAPLLRSGPGKIFWATGNISSHPRLVTEMLADYELPAELSHHYGVELGTKEKAGILGLNFARMAGIDVAEKRAHHATDEFARTRKEVGLRPDYAYWREARASQWS